MEAYLRLCVSVTVIGVTVTHVKAATFSVGSLPRPSLEETFPDDPFLNLACEGLNPHDITTPTPMFIRRMFFLVSVLFQTRG